MFDQIYALTESIRFYFNVHSGKKRIITKKVIPNLKGKSVLDFGCGTGFYTKLMAREAYQVYAVDISAPSLKMAKEINGSSNILYSETLPVVPVDAVVFNDSLEFNSNWQELFATATQHLKVGGKIYIITPVFNSKKDVLYKITLKAAGLYSRLFQQPVRKAQQITSTLEQNRGYFEKYEKNFDATTLGTPESFYFFLQYNPILDFFYSNTRYCNHILHILVKSK